jgi:transglutaminase-like putative cysteine protease
MKTPPFVLGVTLLFWGWQTGFLLPGAIMAGLLEGSRWAKVRWDLSDDDFKRIWSFCALLFLAAAVYAFADNGGPEGVGNLFQGRTVGAQREAGLASARTAAALIRWLPMIFFLFIGAQAFSSSQEIPLHTISLILRYRWNRAKKLGKPLPPAQGVDVGYPYFALCLFAASVHPNENDTFFWGLCLLLGWVLWVRRPRRFGVVLWTSALLLAVAFGYAGARGIGFLQRYVTTFNVQLLAQFFGRDHTDPLQSQTQIGQIGRIKTSTKIVVRLQPKSGPPPAYLRLASYRLFHSPDWLAGGRFRTGFVPVDHAPTNENTWPLEAEKTNASRLGIACYLDGRNRSSGNSMGLLPLPAGSTRLENLSIYNLATNSLGAVSAEGPGLVQFETVYGPGAMIDTPPETNALLRTNLEFFSRFSERRSPTNSVAETSTNAAEFHNRWAFRFGPPDLEVPTNEAPAMDEVLAELKLKGQGREQILRSISDFFATRFSYRTWQDVDNSYNKSATPLGRFLLKTHAGHCEYFATATVLLLRRAGIPARYAVGYSVHETGMGGYVVRQRDAHAWCLVWNGEKKLWDDFDTTPGSWLAVESEHSGAYWPSDMWWWLRFQFSRLRWGQTHLRQYILLGLVPVLALLLFQIVRQRRRRGAAAAAANPVVWPGWDSEFYEVEKRLTQRGLVRDPNESLADWLQRAAAEPALFELKNPLRALLRLHYRYRFDPEGLNEADREELRREARQCVERLSPAQSPAAAH